MGKYNIKLASGTWEIDLVESATVKKTLLKAKRDSGDHRNFVLNAHGAQLTAHPYSRQCVLMFAGKDVCPLTLSCLAIHGKALVLPASKYREKGAAIGFEGI